MVDEDIRVEDGAVLARSVRALAVQAGRKLNESLTEKDFRELLRGIDELERRLDPQAFGELSRWLSSLRRRVESQAMMAV